MKNIKSPYSKMYLVTPAVYEKLLSCLDEKDKKNTQLLNIEKEKEDRPSEQIIQDVTTEEFEPEVMQTQVDIPETPEVFGVEPSEMDVIPSESEIPIEQTIETNVPPGYTDIESNPLKKPCEEKTYDKTRVIPEAGSLMYNPNVKQTKNPATVESKIVKKYRKISKPPTSIKKQLIIPQILRDTPKITQPDTQVITRIQKEEITNPDIPIPPKKKFQCPICLKYFDRPWALQRHVGTVHKNLGSPKDILSQQTKQIVIKPSVIQTGKVIEIPTPSTSFEPWIKPGKRTAVQAKLPSKQQQKYIRRDGKPSEETEVQFESWK